MVLCPSGVDCQNAIGMLYLNDENSFKSGPRHKKSTTILVFQKVTVFWWTLNTKLCFSTQKCVGSPQATCRTELHRKAVGVVQTEGGSENILINHWNQAKSCLTSFINLNFKYVLLIWSIFFSELYKLNLQLQRSGSLKRELWINRVEKKLFCAWYAQKNYWGTGCCDNWRNTEEKNYTIWKT